MLRASCLTLEINEFRCYEAKIEKVKMPAVAGSRTRDTFGLSHSFYQEEPMLSGLLTLNAQSILPHTGNK